MIWLPLKGWEGLYLISENGDLKRLPRLVNYKIYGKMKRLPERSVHQEVIRAGYVRFKLSLNGKTQHLFVHRAVALTFIPNPENKPCVNHIDGNPKNNHIGNLEWCTASENEIHSFRVLGKRPWCKGGQIIAIRKPVIRIDKNGVRKEYACIKDALKDGFTLSHIGECCSGIRKTHKSFYWKFKNAI